MKCGDCAGQTKSQCTTIEPVDLEGNQLFCDILLEQPGRGVGGVGGGGAHPVGENVPKKYCGRNDVKEGVTGKVLSI